MPLLTVLVKVKSRRVVQIDDSICMNMTQDDAEMIMPGNVESEKNAAREHAACIPFKFHVTKKKYCYEFAVMPTPSTISDDQHLHEMKT